ncbi:hypothetical protein QAD02_022693 [Eretmocerus hayati]|uniref:Uncharacterized protein n=1 Tax=Eretmocerus hayati TaxID=131215 RepID=A0ACC2PW91_9HYME|nr:hypothetical protein QAD02_022693 [Eretmocerus hayati]
MTLVHRRYSSETGQSVAIELTSRTTNRHTRLTRSNIRPYREDEGTGENSLLCPREGCGRKFRPGKAYYQHIRYGCSQNLRYKCGYCSQISSRPDNVRAHIINKHHDHEILVFDLQNNGEPYKFAEKAWFHCPREGCDRKYPRHSDLKYHLEKQYSSGTSATEFLPVITPSFNLQQMAYPETYQDRDPLSDEASHSRRCRVYRSRYDEDSDANDEQDDDVIEVEQEETQHETKKPKPFTHPLITRMAFDGKTRFMCPNKLCKRSYTNHDAFYKHVRYECGKRRRFKCGYCEYKGLRASTTRQHIARAHRGCEYIVLDTYNKNKVFVSKRWQAYATPPELHSEIQN